jgi:hypothetical protein
MKRWLLFFVVIATLLCILPSAVYLMKFRLNMGINSTSPNPVDWGVLGDFIGGVTNTVISFLNLMAFLYLTYQIHQIDHNAKERDASNRVIELDIQTKLNIHKGLREALTSTAFHLIDNEKKYNKVIDSSKRFYFHLYDAMETKSIGITNEEANKILEGYKELLKEVYNHDKLEDDKRNYETAQDIMKIIEKSAEPVFLKIRNSLQSRT